MLLISVARSALATPKSHLRLLVNKHDGGICRRVEFVVLVHVISFLVLLLVVVCLVEIEQQKMRALCRRKSDFSFVVQRSAVAGRKFLSIQVKVAFDQLNPGVTLFFQRLVNFSLGGEFADVKADILIDFDGTVAAVWPNTPASARSTVQPQTRLGHSSVSALCGLEPARFARNDLVGRRIVEFTMRNARSGRDSLHLASFHHCRCVPCCPGA